MDVVVIIPYLVLFVLSFVVKPPETDSPMRDFAKYLLSFHGFIFLKLCRYFPVIQRLLFTSIKFAKVTGKGTGRGTERVYVGTRKVKRCVSLPHNRR